MLFYSQSHDVPTHLGSSIQCRIWTMLQPNLWGETAQRTGRTPRSVRASVSCLITKYIHLKMNSFASAGGEDWGFRRRFNRGLFLLTTQDVWACLPTSGYGKRSLFHQFWPRVCVDCWRPRNIFTMATWCYRFGYRSSSGFEMNGQPYHFCLWFHRAGCCCPVQTHSMSKKWTLGTTAHFFEVDQMCLPGGCSSVMLTSLHMPYITSAYAISTGIHCFVYSSQIVDTVVHYNKEQQR